MKIFKIIIVSLFLVGCSDVKPWEKGDLARPHMVFDPSAGNSKFNQHVYHSKEGASGGYGIAGGGCGCN